MVVSHNQVDTCFRSCLAGVKRPNSAVDTNDQLVAFFGRVFDHLGFQAVAFFQAAGQVEFRSASQHLQSALQHDDGCNPIDVIIAIDQDSFPALDRLEHARNHPVHVFHQEGIMKLGELRAKESSRLFGGIEPAVEKQPGSQFGDTDLRGQIVHLGIRSGQQVPSRLHQRSLSTGSVKIPRKFRGLRGERTADNADDTRMAADSRLFIRGHPRIIRVIRGALSALTSGAIPR